MLHTECFFFFLFHLCSCWESNGARTHANTLRSRVSQRHQLLHGVTHIHCDASFFPSPRGPSRAQGGRKKKKRTRWFMYTFYLCWSSEGEPGLLSQQRTTHHFLLSSLLLGLITESKHSGSVILLVSQGRLLIQFSPQHCTMVWFSDGGRGRGKKEKICVSVAPKHIAGLH